MFVSAIYAGLHVETGKDHTISDYSGIFCSTTEGSYSGDHAMQLFPCHLHFVIIPLGLAVNLVLHHRFRL